MHGWMEDLDTDIQLCIAGWNPWFPMKWWQAIMSSLEAVMSVNQVVVVGNHVEQGGLVASDHGVVMQVDPVEHGDVV